MAAGSGKELGCVLTFEQVLEIFKDYLAQDNEVEVIRTKRGYLRITWAGDFPFCDEGQLCKTPEILFDVLLEDCQNYHEVELTKGRRELTAEDVKQASAKCRPYIEKRWEAEKK